MNATKIKPYYAVHPGEVLKEELENRGIALSTLSDLTLIPQEDLSLLVDCQKPLTAEMAIILERALDIPTRPLLKMQMDYDMQTAEESPSFRQRLAQVRRYAAMF